MNDPYLPQKHPLNKLKWLSGSSYWVVGAGDIHDFSDKSSWETSPLALAIYNPHWSMNRRVRVYSQPDKTIVINQKTGEHVVTLTHSERIKLFLEKWYSGDKVIPFSYYVDLDEKHVRYKTEAEETAEEEHNV